MTADPNQQPERPDTSLDKEILSIKVSTRCHTSGGWQPALLHSDLKVEKKSATIRANEYFGGAVISDRTMRTIALVPDSLSIEGEHNRALLAYAPRLLEIVEQLQSELAAAREALKWRPIETAPRDGSVMVTKELREHIERNADRTLWCVHVLGPDDVEPMESHAAAVAQADALNVAIHHAIHRDAQILCFAYAAPWPHDAASHAKGLAQQDDQPCAERLAETEGGA